jgi:hydrogenase assembly chaperone HypC/HupF
MCLTAPVRVISVESGTATVDIGGARREASTLAVPAVRPGDWALMSSGMLLRVLDAEHAAELHAALRTAAGDGR